MRLRDTGWTPSAKDADPLLEVVATGSDNDAKAAEKAIRRMDPMHVRKIAAALVARVETAERPGRGRLALLATKYNSEPNVHAWLVAALADADPKTRRNAARGLGKEAEADLLRAFDDAPTEDDRRAFADALSRIGSKGARERIERLATGDLRMTRAAVIRDREEARAESGGIDLEGNLGEPIVMRFHTRVGLERIVLEELGEAARPRIASPGIVEARLEGPLSRALEVRTAMHVGFPIDPVRLAEDPADSIVALLRTARVKKIFAAYTTPGPVRFRLSFEGSGHHRPLVWNVAEKIKGGDLVNDPKSSTWEVMVTIDGGFLSIELVPRGFVDPRFAYRVATVPASSHPVIAAALARCAPRRDDDVVWDPFCGAGAELRERARIGPFARLIGTDVETEALEASKKNLEGLEVDLQIADALGFDPGGVTAIITNPPMGRRVERGRHTNLLLEFVDHAAKILAPSGVLVWTVPEPREVHARAEKAGLVLERAFTVDMGGFPAALSIHRRP